MASWATNDKFCDLQVDLTVDSIEIQLIVEEQRRRRPEMKIEEDQKDWRNLSSHFLVSGSIWIGQNILKSLSMQMTKGDKIKVWGLDVLSNSTFTWCHFDNNYFHSVNKFISWKTN